MPKDDLVYLGHMLDAARKIRVKVQRITREKYDADENLRLALTHLLQIIGEAARQVSQGTRAANPDIPWPAIVGMRHRVVHDYMNVDFDIVWLTATTEIPPLIEQLKTIVPPGE